MTTFTTFNVNDMVFVQGLGYGTLLQCGNAKSIAVKEPPTIIEKKQSIYFDPELFNSDPETLTRQKSDAAVLVTNHKAEPKENGANFQDVPINDKKQEQLKDKEKAPEVPQQKKLNIVKIRLEGTNVLVHTLDSNIRKYVIVPVKPLFLPAIGTLNIKIQIGKTIESFKKQILDLLGLKHSHYFNLKLFTTSPCLSEFNCPGKTIWQYGIRQNSILTMTAEHGFCFQNVPAEHAEFFSILNNGLTFLSLPKKLKVPNAVIALPPTPASIPNPKANNVEETQPQNTQKKQEIATKQKEAVQVKTEEQKKEETKPAEEKEKSQQEKVINQPAQSLRLCGDKLLRSGKHYFQVRLDKLPQNSSHLKIGISEVGQKRSWLYCPLNLQKIQEECETKLTEPYGMTLKQNDVVGVLAKIDKQRILRVTFFKNGVNLGQCFEGQIQEAKFIFEVGSEGQISIDTRAQPPLDSYRFR